jgi:hypothetical protein
VISIICQTINPITYQVSLIRAGNNEKRSLSNLGIIVVEERGVNKRGGGIVAVCGGELDSNLRNQCVKF